MRPSLCQIAAHFSEFTDQNFSVASIVLHPLDFLPFYEQNDGHIQPDQRPVGLGETVGYLWGAAIRLSNGIKRNGVRIVPDPAEGREPAETERELWT